MACSPDPGSVTWPIRGCAGSLHAFSDYRQVARSICQAHAVACRSGNMSARMGDLRRRGFRCIPRCRLPEMRDLRVGERPDARGVESRIWLNLQYVRLGSAVACSCRLSSKKGPLSHQLFMSQPVRRSPGERPLLAESEHWPQSTPYTIVPSSKPMLRSRDSTSELKASMDA